MQVYNILRQQVNSTTIKSHFVIPFTALIQTVIDEMLRVKKHIHKYSVTMTSLLVNVPKIFIYDLKLTRVDFNIVHTLV